MVDDHFTYESRLASFKPQPLPSKKRASTRSSNASTRSTKNTKASAKSAKWPHKFLSPAELAFAGFFYQPLPTSDDNVTCFLCLKSMDGWEKDDDPLEEHLKHSPDCGWALVKRVEKLADGLIQEYPLSSEMIEARKATFADKWPHEDKKGWKCKVKQLVDAGWNYTPTEESDDSATCAYCQLSLDGWEQKDKPMDEHHKRSPDCPFFTLVTTMKPPKATRGKKRKSSVSSSQGKRRSRSTRASSVSSAPAAEYMSEAEPSEVDEAVIEAELEALEVEEAAIESQLKAMEADEADEAAVEADVEVMDIDEAVAEEDPEAMEVDEAVVEEEVEIFEEAMETIEVAVTKTPTPVRRKPIPPPKERIATPTPPPKERTPTPTPTPKARTPTPTPPPREATPTLIPMPSPKKRALPPTPSPKKHTPSPKKQAPILVSAPRPETPSLSPQSSDAENRPPPITPVVKVADEWVPIDVDTAFEHAGFAAELEEFQDRALTENELDMTVEEWIHHNARAMEAMLLKECERKVGIFEREGQRAIRAIEALQTVD